MMKISFELSDKDLRYFRQVLQKVRKGRSAENEDLILTEAKALLEEVAKTDAPQYVQGRIAQLGQLIDMLEDADWRLEGADRKRVLNALAYFADPDDLIPDRVPGLGYLDDAIMVELVVQDLKHEIEAFEAFVAYRKERRKKKLSSKDGLEKRRTSLQGRMRRRRQGDRNRHSRKRGRSPIGLW
ncbi:MAG: YkvA family protein [Myxococcales bacterium]